MTVTANTIVGAAGTSQIVSTGDFNHDGTSDLAFQDVPTGNVSVWHMTTPVVPTAIPSIADTQVVGSINTVAWHII